MNEKLYKQYDDETRIGGYHECTYTEWLESIVLQTIVQQPLSGSDETSSPKLPYFLYEYEGRILIKYFDGTDVTDWWNKVKYGNFR